MTTWTMTQVQQVRGIRSQTVIDAAMAELALADVKHVARQKMFKGMVEMAHPFAVELHPGDVRFDEAEAPEHMPPGSILIRSWWEPPTKTIELRGGEGDGQMLEFRGAPHDPLRVSRAAGLSWSPLETATIERTEDVYRCAGWSEDERHWVYAIT